jgi:glycosyltransferase involved in cell wall biosynthesis
LENGRYGPLVPVGDAQALADAILETLDTPADRQRLQNRGADFSLEAASQKYVKLINRTRHEG